jgi:hypothetical protein
VKAGVVEGFYGKPWSQVERLRLLSYYPALGLSCYYHAPKDDPYHRKRWDEPYPEAELACIAGLAAYAGQRGIEFTACLAPGLSMRYCDPDDQDALARKVRQLAGAGVRRFALLFDDIPPVLTEPAAVARFGAGASGLGRAHGRLCADLAGFLSARLGIATPVEICPTDYAGCQASDYRLGLAETLPEDALVMWTGRDVVVGDITEEEVAQAWASFGRDLILWDNFPVNDFDFSRVFLGPLLGRPAYPAGLAKIISNPMVEASASLIPLATVGSWATDPSGYQPEAALDAALALLAAPIKEALLPLVRACASWPPSAVRDADLAALLETPDDPRLTTRLAELATLEIPLTGDPLCDDLAETLAPWARAARLAGQLGLAVLALRQERDEPTKAEAERLLAAYQSEPKDVLRPLLTTWAEQQITAHALLTERSKS